MKTNGDDTGGTGGTTSMETVRHAHLGWSGHFDCDSRCQYNDEYHGGSNTATTSDRKDNGKAFVMEGVPLYGKQRTTVRAAPQTSKVPIPTRYELISSGLYILNTWTGWKNKVKIRSGFTEDCLLKLA